MLDILNSFDSLTIEIINWNKYQERDSCKKGVSSYHWFKISDDHLSDPKILSLSDSGYKLFIALLCIASKQNSQIVNTNLTHLRLFTGKKLSNIKHNLGQMAEIALIQVIENIENGGLYKIRRDEIRRDNIRENDNKILNINKTSENKPDLLAVSDLWLAVLATFKIEREKIHLQEAQMLQSLLAANGKEYLATAIIGMAYEARSDSYQPEKFLSTKLLANNFERFLNIGCKNKNDFISRHNKHLTEASYNLIKPNDEVIVHG